MKDQPNLAAYAVTVGKKPTAAAAYIDDPAAVLELLNSLSKYSNKEKKFFSAMDLPSQATQHAGGVHGFATAVQAEHQLFTSAAGHPAQPSPAVVRVCCGL